jgi:hypothetical protein
VRLLALLLVLPLSGCFVQIRDERVAEAAAFILFGGMAVHHISEDLRNPRPMPSLSNSFSPWVNSPPPAPMDPNRKVNEQDCSQPIDFTLGNIKCK